MIIQKRSRRKPSGGRYKSAKGKKFSHKGNLPRETKLGKPVVNILRTRGGKDKDVTLSANLANVYDPKTKKYQKLKIETIVDNPANRHFIRRNIMTKGAIIKTEKGNAKITNRPGQEGIVNAVLLEK